MTITIAASILNIVVAGMNILGSLFLWWLARRGLKAAKMNLETARKLGRHIDQHLAEHHDLPGISLFFPSEDETRQ